MILIYVDDLIIAAESVDTINELKTLIMSRFNCKDLGELKRYLGMWVVRSENKVYVHQDDYARDIVTRFLHHTRHFYKTPKKLSLPSNIQELLMDENQRQELLT